jgi:putative membrane protein
MAGILYLYRLFIYHRERAIDQGAIHDLLSIMEYRLYTYITVPAMIASWIAGLTIVFHIPGFLTAPWMLLKFAAVIALSASTLYAGHLRKKFANLEKNLPTSKALRWMNEIPTVLMLIIVGFVVFKPF